MISLPTGAALQFRHLYKDGTCSHCQTKDETANHHLLFKCPYARLIWTLSPIPAPPGGEFSDSLFQNIHWVLSLAKYTKEEQQKAGPWIMYGRAETNSYSKEKIQAQPPLMRHEEKWIPPTQHMFKCNVDGAWSKDNEHCGVGWFT
ncbi:hypothetical protein Bca101_066683 [Brassica carinata]